MKAQLVRLACGLLAVWLAHAPRSVWAADLFPFVLPWDDSTPGITDLSGLLDKPAGQGGYISVGPDGHFYAGGKRVRFMGVNLAFAGGMPAKTDGEKVAGRMAKFGINVVRFHHMDTSAWPNGLRKRNARDTGQLEPEALDRMDYFIAQLKARGIYANINLLVGRPFNAADGLPREIESMDSKDRHVVGFWNEKELALQKSYARTLLTHVNPYTESPYTAEPAVAFVEINNENGLIHAWLGGEVDRYPEVFTSDLQAKWNAWLKQKYETTEKLRAVWSQGAEPLGPELLKDGAFTNQTSGWNLEQHIGAQATLVRTNATVRVHVFRPGTESWHVQMTQGGLQLEGGQAYTLSFRARAATARTISVVVAQAHEPYGGLGLSASPQLTNAWRDYRYVFNASAHDRNARVSFGSFGSANAEIELADVSLRPGGVEGLGSREQLGTVSRFEKVTYGRRTPEAQRDWMRFLFETEERYWQAMYHFLKDELKVKALVGGTIGGCSPLNIQSKMDWVDTHSYWQHPRFPHRSWDPADWLVDNKSMVNERGGTLPGLALKRVAGKPHAVTEYNHAAPNTFGSEGFLLLAAYGGLQDWDAIYGYAYAHTRANTAAWDSRQINGFFDIDQHPTKMAAWVTAAAMFLRGDVKPASLEAKASLPRETEIDLLRTASAWSLVDGAKAGLARETPLIQRVTVSPESFQTPKFAFPRPSFQSDTGELFWESGDEKRGVVTINSPATKGVIGYAGGKRYKLGNVTIEPGKTMQDGWCTVTVTTMASGPAGPTAYLVTATGMAENTDMGWKNREKSTVGRDWGTAPSLVEGIPLRLILSIPPNTLAEAWALDPRGQRAQAISVANANGMAVISVGSKTKTLWYEVRLK